MFDSPEELTKKIQLGEDNSFEYKAVIFRGSKVVGPGRDNLADEIAAMANANDSVLILGVDDKTKEVIGIPMDKLDAVEDFVREICNDTLKPPVLMRAYRIELPAPDGTMLPVLKVEIPRSLFVHQSPGGYFFRQGSSKRQMQPDFLARMFQQRSQARLIRFEEQDVPGTSMDSLEQNLWERFTSQSDEAADVVLLKRNLLARSDSGEIKASVAGILMCCENPEQYMPSAYIEAVRYRGTLQDSNYQLDAQKIIGPLDRQIDHAMSFFKKNQTVAAIKTPARVDMPQYNERAVFEALVNAVAHRDYAIYGSKIRFFMFDDRMEIYSPGALPNTVTIESIALRQDTRNELLTSLLAECPIKYASDELGRRSYMEKRGDGVPIILSRSERHSGRKPEYRLIDDSELLLIIHAAQPPESSPET